MPTVRKFPLVTGEIYHVFNRGIDKRTVFTGPDEYIRAIKTFRYYQYVDPPMKLSNYLSLTEEFRQNVDISANKNKLVSIFSYCLMPNHFHFELRQEVDKGTSKFIGQFLNSYTRYFNTKHKRVGGLFIDQFKNTLITGENELLHVSRYIHLNPYSSGVVKRLNDLSHYRWSSYYEYLRENSQSVCDRNMVMSSFNNNIKLYRQFVMNQAEYQKELKEFES